jgi:peroxiredoxin Q/BCP
MAQLRQDYDEFLKRNVEIIVIGPEKPEAFKKYWQSNQLPFVGLPDPRGSVLKLYGQEVNLFKLGRMPAQLIVDIQGVVRFVHYGHAMYDIPSTDEILVLLDEISEKPDR